MGVPTNNIYELERQRRELEANILKLQESLYHWRTWEAEYDGLKEEIDNLDENASTDDFLRIGRDFGGDLVNEEEVKVILGAKQGVTRSKEQAVSLISRRIDYVRENVRIIEKRLLTAENQLSGLDAVGQAPSVTDPQLPMTEIMEELDEEGNVVSGSTQTPGSEAPELLNILKRVGAEIPDTQQDTKTGTQSKVEEVEDSQADKKKEEEMVGPTPKETHRAIETQPEPPNSTPVEPRPEIPEEHPVTEVDESPEDAALRREMLEYGMNEIGAVVAELELDENGSDVSYDDGYGTYDEDDEEEDEFGRSTGSVLSEDYHKQMRELEEKLGAKGMWNMGKDTATLPDEMQHDLDQSDAPAPGKEKSKKKKVAFADDLDIAPAAEPRSTEKKTLPPQQPDVPTMSDAIIERAEPAAKTSAPAEAPKKASRFKSVRKNALSSEPTAPTPSTNISFRPPEVRSTARKSDPSPSLPLFPAKPAEPKPFSQPIADVFAHEKPPVSEPQPPQDKVLADRLVERDIKEGSAPAPEADEIEESIHRKEVASEFYRMRNRMIQQNGGFMNNEPETVPLDEDDAPRVSKFKAARMNKS